MIDDLYPDTWWVECPLCGEFVRDEEFTTANCCEECASAFADEEEDDEAE